MIPKEMLGHYFSVTEEAYGLATQSTSRVQLGNAREDFLDMVSRYIADARFFEKKGDSIRAFAALNYAHGWLDAGARIGIFDVHDNRLFTVD